MTIVATRPVTPDPPAPERPSEAPLAPEVDESVRDAELWEAARAEADRRGETVSDAIRRSLRRYVKQKTHA